MAQFYQILTWLGVFLYWLTIASVTMRVVFKRRVVGVSLAWLMIIFIIPVVGVFAYLLFGELNMGKKRAERAKEMYQPFGDWFQRLFNCAAYRATHTDDFVKSIRDLCENRLGIPALSGNQLSLYSSPHATLGSMLSDIQQAKHSIHMEFYIWHSGGMTDQICAELLLATKRGVKVKILLDAAGSMRFFRTHWPELMRASGIEVIAALAVSPMRVFLRRLDLRQHRKIVVIDDSIAYTGSMNMVDPDFFKVDAGVGKWIDIMVRVTGSSVAVLGGIQAWDWEVETGKRELPELPPSDTTPSVDRHDLIQVIPSGPGMPDDIIQQVLLLSIYQAAESIVITTPYFVPSENLVHGLKCAAERGVRVDIIIPDKNDSMMVDWASRSFFSELLAGGVNIYRFRGGLLHSKSVVIDSTYCLLGSVNIDMRSLWLNFEVTLMIDNLALTQELASLQQQYLEDATLVVASNWHKRPLHHKLLEQCFYMFSPLL